MAAPITNWIFDNKTVTEKDIHALEKVKKKEKKNQKAGYRWIRVANNSRLHVPCDKNGEPTEEGKRMIRIFLQHESPYL